jgi:hypothetical protein
LLVAITLLGAVLFLAQVGQVAGKVVVQRGQGVLAVQLHQVAEQSAQAQGIGGEHVEVQVQTGAVGQQRQLDIQHLALFNGQLTVGQLGAQGRQPLLHLLGAGLAQVMHRQSRPRAVREDLLAAVIEKLHPQHRVPREQGTYGRFQPYRVNVLAIELVIEVRGHATQLLAGGAADPVGVLHRREFER